MNRDRVKVLADLYAKKYSDITVPENDIRALWTAADHCVANWDINTENFGEMFADAMRYAVFLTDDDVIQPQKGILVLCENGQEDRVREAFLRLLMPDGGSIEHRAERINEFCRTINTMLTQMKGRTWNLRQKVSDATVYLTMIRPDQDYIYCSWEAERFAGYTEFDEELGYGRDFSLEHYYEMCDELTAALADSRNIQEKNTRGIKNLAKAHHNPNLQQIDVKGHLLVSALIRAAYEFHFYDEKSTNRKSKISTVQRRKLDNTRKRAELLEDREKVLILLDEITADEHKITMPDMVGMTASHEKFGKGSITEQKGRYLIIDFSDQNLQKKFALPGVITNRFISVEDSNVMKVCTRMDELQQKHSELDRRLSSIDVQIRMLE